MIYTEYGLKLGILDFVPLLGQADAAEAISQTVRLAKFAEAWGYERLWVTEHHDMEKLASANPEVLLAYLGAHTSRIRLGSGAVLLPYYKPMKVAEAFHLLATLFPGRIDLGIGRAPGGSAHASMSLSDIYLEQVRRMPQLLDELTDLLAGRFRIDGQPVFARPVPPVPPELWLLGTNAKSAGYAAERGAGYVFGQFMSDQDGAVVLEAYRERFNPGALGGAPRTIVAVGAVCAKTDDEAAVIAAAGVRRTFGTPDDTAPAGHPNRLITGSPERVKRKLLELCEQYRTNEIMLVTTTAGYEERLNSFRLLAQAFGA